MGRRPGWRAAGGGNQETCSARGPAASGFVGMGFVSGLSLARRLARPILGLAQGPSWWPVYLSAKDPGRLVVSSLLLSPSQILQFSLQGSTPFLIRASGCETSRASDDYRAWPRWVVSVLNTSALSISPTCTVSPGNVLPTSEDGGPKEIMSVKAF